MSAQPTVNEKASLEKIQLLKKNVFAKIEKLQEDYIKLVQQDTHKEITSELGKLLGEIVLFKESYVEADKKKQEIPQLPLNASLDMFIFEEEAKKAFIQEHYAHWLMLSECCSAANQLFMQKDFTSQKIIIEDDINLLSSIVKFSRNIVVNPSEFESYKIELDTITDKIAQRCKDYSKYYNNKMVMPKVWGGLLIALGVLIAAAAVAAGAAMLALSGGTAVVPGVLTLLLLPTTGISLITAGWGYMEYQSEQIQKEQPAVTSKIADSLHRFYSEHEKRSTPKDEYRAETESKIP